MVKSISISPPPNLLFCLSSRKTRVVLMKEVLKTTWTHIILNHYSHFFKYERWKWIISNLGWFNVLHSILVIITIHHATPLIAPDIPLYWPHFCIKKMCRLHLESIDQGTHEINSSKYLDLQVTLFGFPSLLSLLWIWFFLLYSIYSITWQSCRQIVESLIMYLPLAFKQCVIILLGRIMGSHEKFLPL